MSYRPPVEDIAWSLKVAGHSSLARSYFTDLDEDTIRAILDAAADFASSELAPLNVIGDRIGAKLEDGVVRCPPGFAEAYAAFVDGGWNSLSAEVHDGGQGLSKAMEFAVFEMMDGANMAFSMCPKLTQGAIEALNKFGSERQKALYLPKMVSGAWSGTMNLTESQAGTDLAAISTIATPQGDRFRIRGQKIFITYGDHDLAENIVHLVLARTPDAPPGVKGISLFLVSKRQVAADGSLGEPNQLHSVSLEEKLGVHASPTCVMLYDDADAELVGELHRGLPQMFVMMNAARLQVGVEAVGVAERAFQLAHTYCLERRQGRSDWSRDPQARIYDHPDVRRSLALMKAKIVGARGMCLMAAVAADVARYSPMAEERAAARLRLELLTPICKSWSTDVGVDVASMGVQLHGGVGFIEETGAAQHLRDVRITPIYEGTNGIQAIDLVVRKVQLDGGTAMAALLQDIRADAATASVSVGLEDVGQQLSAAAAATASATSWLVEHRGGDALAGAATYAKLAGDLVAGWVLCREALAATDSCSTTIAARPRLARLFVSQVLTAASGLSVAAMAGFTDLEALLPEALV